MTETTSPNQLGVTPTASGALQADLNQFGNIALSALSTHGGDCCAASRLGITSRLAYPTVAASLAALPRVVSWRPIRWPAFWCDLEDEPNSFIGDCGVHATLAATLLETFDLPHERVQIAISSPPGHHAHWRASWDEAGANAAWLGEVAVYHEALRIGDRYWDPSEARFFSGVGAALLAGLVVGIRGVGQPWTTSTAIIRA